MGKQSLEPPRNFAALFHATFLQLLPKVSQRSLISVFVLCLVFWLVSIVPFLLCLVSAVPFHVVVVAVVVVVFGPFHVVTSIIRFHVVSV